MRRFAQFDAIFAKTGGVLLLVILLSSQIVQMVLNRANSHISLLAVEVMFKVFTVLIKVSICARN